MFRRTRALGMVLGMLVGGMAWAQAGGAQLLFGAAGAGVPVADQQAILRLLEWRVAPGGKALLAPDCGEVFHETQVLDLNGDGTPEVLVVGGNSCTSGQAGSSVFLFIKGAQGRYARQLGFPGAAVTPLPTRSQGWPDLRIGGPGFCEAVWGWKGGGYDFKCSQETQRGGCRGVSPGPMCRR